VPVRTVPLPGAEVSPTPFAEVEAALLARGPGRMIADLDRIRQLAGLLGDPQLAYPSVHVTGTNGKGSVVRMVGALCAAAGLSAGTYTSPHLQTVRERISIAGRHLSESRFAALYDEVVDLVDLVDTQARAQHPDDHVTYFELLTAMAYWAFADAPVDVGVFEVGMGGRWDATNLVRGDVAVINEIDLDHAELGSTPATVAAEKAGIVKPSSHVLTAHQRPDVEEVLAAAIEEAGATWWRADRDVEVVDRRVAVGGQLLTLRVGERVIDEVLLPLFGAHQARNAALAVGALAALTGDAFAAMEDDVVRHGLGAVVVPGRLEVVRRDPTVVLDAAHNPHGARAVAAALEESFGFQELVLVAACLDDKDVDGILRELAHVASHVIVTQAPSPRAADRARMYEAALQVWGDSGTVVEAAADLDEALELAESLVREGDGVLVAGSVHTVGGARDRYLPVDELTSELGADDEVVVTPLDEDDGVGTPRGREPRAEVEGEGFDPLRALAGEPEEAEEPMDPAEAEEFAAAAEDEARFQAALEELFEGRRGDDHEPELDQDDDEDHDDRDDG
jgi:dihydrofolate synthase/folylpolyglutamate synthase